jgi:hypothetical protein
MARDWSSDVCSSDLYALKEASLKFAVKDSISAKLFHANNLTFTEVTDFRPVLNSLVNDLHSKVY